MKILYLAQQLMAKVANCNVASLLLICVQDNFALANVSLANDNHGYQWP